MSHRRPHSGQHAGHAPRESVATPEQATLLDPGTGSGGDGNAPPAVAQQVRHSSAGIRDVGAEEVASQVTSLVRAERVRRATWSLRGALVMVSAAVLAALGVAAWDARRANLGQAELTCTPAFAELREPDSTSSKVQILAGTADGSRILVSRVRTIFGHPWTILVGYEAGNRHELLHVALPRSVMPPTTQEGLLELARVLPGMAEQFPQTVTPTRLPHCAVKDVNRISGKHAVALQWRGFHDTGLDERCRGYWGVSQWKLCSPTHPAACTLLPVVDGACVVGPPQLTDVLEVGDTVWMVSEQQGTGGDTPPVMTGISWSALLAGG